MSKTVAVLAAKFLDFTVFNFSGSVVIKMVMAGTAHFVIHGLAMTCPLVLSCTGILREEQRPDETVYRGRSQDKSHGPHQGFDWSTSVRTALLAYGPSEAEGSVFIRVHMYVCTHW